jgi:hypothetical protein
VHSKSYFAWHVYIIACLVHLLLALAGVTLVAEPASGPFFLSATAANLAPGTNYTLLTAVRQLSVLSPGVTALTGILVPDTTAPSFTRSAVLSAARTAAQPGRFTVQMVLGLNEQGRVHYAVYGHPSCITGATVLLWNLSYSATRICHADVRGATPTRNTGASARNDVQGVAKH